MNIPTRLDNILDLIFTNNPSLIYDILVIKTVMSGHNIIEIITNLGKRNKHTDAEEDDRKFSFRNLNFFIDNTNWEKNSNKPVLSV